ncbi:hypothetical protein [Teichococcus aestuarii]|uniref:hypothetical protein n=1 Tax=Teichococcus aestuarii TaxID=568898 RepID=UPI0011B1D416|nr:hypothetical protein [Pseudoroseomonas aestuarii]
MIEPNAPASLEKITRNVLRTLLNQYASDPDYIWAFQKEHAILAMPVCLFRDVGKKLSGLAVLHDDDVEKCRSYFRDKNGPYEVLLSIMKRVTEA